MNDLLSEVRIDTNASTLNGGRGATNGDLEQGPSYTQTDQEVAMAPFFAAVAEIKADAESIRALQREIVELNEKGKTLVKTKDVTQHQAEMQAKISQVSTLARAAKRKLDELDKENAKAKTVPGQGEGTVNERTRTSITSGLKVKLKDLMAEFNKLRTRMEDEYHGVVARRLQTVTGVQPSDEDVDKIIEGGEGEKIFQAAMETQGRGRVLDVLAEIRERNSAVKDLLQSLVELHQIFLDMAVMVEQQGEQLDSIQKQVEKSLNFVEGGTKEVVKAKNIQKNTRKWICFGVIILIIIILIIILAGVQPWKYTNN